MKKLVITIILSSIALTGSVFAHDCDIVSGESNKIIDSIVTTYGKNTTIANPISTNSKILIKYTNVVPTEAFRQALINLKAYCCSQILSCTKAEKNNLPTKYPASAYLFDHLIDITMRRLDGIPSLAYGLKSVDPTALIRRNKITEIANSVPPNTPQAKEIEALYKNYWTLHEGETKNLYTVIEKYNDYNGEIPIISLADKYNTLCEITKMIYEQTKLNSNISI